MCLNLFVITLEYELNSGGHGSSVPCVILFISTSLLFSLQSDAPSFGLLFDIDGVIVRGKKIIPKVPETFKRLINSEGKFRIPTVFLTNAGNGLTEEKAKRLSEWLNIEVGFYNFVLSISVFTIIL